MAFKIAASMAFKDACRKASPIILEPVMAVEVVVPEDFMGDVIGDLSSRRGKIQGMEARGGAQVIGSQVPLAEMFRLRHRPAFDDAGPRHLHHAVFALRTGTADDLRGDHR